MFSLGSSGAPQIAARLDSLLRALEDHERVGQIFLAGAQAMRDDAKSRVDVRTGHLRDNIFAAARRTSRYPMAVVGVRWKDVPYCWDVEFGTTKMAARPFLRPAAVAAAEAALERAAEAGRAFLEAAVL
jgi:HK97 gp10 family phage protein